MTKNVYKPSYIKAINRLIANNELININTLRKELK